MPFGLKNAGATYQRAMQNIFDDLLHKNIECYMDDLVVKSRKRGDHLKDLRMVFELLWRENPIKFMMSKPVLSDRLARWYLQFQQFEIVYIPQKAITGQVLADFLADYPIPDDWELTDELPDEDAMVIEVQPPWKKYFDGAAHRGGVGVGAGVVFVTSQGEVLPYSFTLTQLYSNNVAEYQALILGLEMTVEIKRLQLQHVPRKKNKKADALAALASSLTLPNQAQVTVYQKWVVPLPNEAKGEENERKHLVAVSEIEKEEWRQPVIDCLCYEILSENPKRRTEIRHRAPSFLYYKDTLYRRSFEGVLFRCLGEDEVLQALQEAYSGAEVVALKEVKKKNVASSIPQHDFVANGLAEAFNKALCNLIKKVISKSKRDWNDRMEEALWAYRMTHRTPTQATPYSLVYGVKVVLPLERQIPLLRLAIQEEITDEENTRLRLVELEALDEKSLEAQQSLEWKFTSKWDGPYVVQESYSSGAYKLVDADGMRIDPINGKFLKKYYP
ncbi:uncharacterized protein [Nicotiana sylvestris]|uniref:uncharacterized protein n=1 Tax=Nicotiana sylvestris TaxID=4096 RepID=UPI00388CC836